MKIEFGGEQGKCLGMICNQRDPFYLLGMISRWSY